MSPEELVIEILLRRATVKGELTEEEICNICEERNIAYAKTSYIIEKLMSKGVRIISTNYGNSYGKKNSRKSSYNLKTSRSDYQFDSAKTESISNSLSSDNDIASDDTIVNLYSEKAYADCMPTYLKYKNEVFYLNNWKDVYVKVMSLLAYRYDSKLASWAGFGDIFRIKDLPSDYSEDNFKPISRDIYIKTDYNTEELLFKIRKYINVCNADIKDIVIGCKKNTDVNAEHEKKKSADDGKSLINEETKTTADNISDLPTEKVHISETEINTIPAKTEVKQSEIKPVSKTSDSIIKCVSSINDSFSATISKLKKAASEIIECEDHEKAVTVFSEIHSNICSLNAIKTTLDSFLNKINNTQQIINTALSAESSFNTIDEVVEYTDKVIMEYKKKLCLIISSLSSDILTDELESNIATLNVLMSLNAELKRIRELLNLNNNEKNTSQNNAELNASKKIYELTVFSDFTKMKVKSIKLMNSTYEVKGMDEAFSIICYVLRSINKDKISYLVNRYLIVAEKKVKIFSYYCEEQGFQPLGNSGIYYNINDMTNDEIVLTIRILLQFYNLRPEADLVFYATDIDA